MVSSQTNFWTQKYRNVKDGTSTIKLFIFNQKCRKLKYILNGARPVGKLIEKICSTE
jgi:hypothetical protein